MPKSDQGLVILLRFAGVTAPFPLVAVPLPVAWMAAGHRWLGQGEMPAAPVVEKSHRPEARPPRRMP